LVILAVLTVFATAFAMTGDRSFVRPFLRGERVLVAGTVQDLGVMPTQVRRRELYEDISEVPVHRHRHALLRRVRDSDLVWWNELRGSSTGASVFRESLLSQLLR